MVQSLTFRILTMPKVRLKRKKKSDAFKKLIKAHKKGPKRLTLYKERVKEGEDPLLNPSKSKHIQLMIKSCYEIQYICVVVLPISFKKMSLSQGKTYTMTNKRLTRAGRCLYKTFDVLDHNDRIFERVHHMNLTSAAGKCLVVAGKFKVPDATLIITSEEKLARRTHPEVVVPKCSGYEIEYM